MKFSVTWALFFSTTGFLVAASPPGSPPALKRSTPLSESASSESSQTAGGNHRTTLRPIPRPTLSSRAPLSKIEPDSQDEEEDDDGDSASPTQSTQGSSSTSEPDCSDGDDGDRASSTTRSSASPSTTPSRASSSTTHSSASSTKSLDPEGSPYDWMKVKCTDPTAKDEAMDPEERWKKSGAVHAWGRAVAHWLDFDTDRKFTQSIVDFFGGPPNTFCGDNLGDETNCQTVPDCSNEAAHGFNSSGGYVITRSMFTLNQGFENVLTAFDKGKDQTNLVEMTNTFGAVKDEKRNEDALTSAVLLVFGIANTKVMRKVFKTKPSKRKNREDDSTDDSVSQSLAALKAADGVGKALAKWETANDVMDTIHSAWVDAIAATAKDIFNGSANSNGDLYNRIDDGQLLELDRPAGTKEDDIKDAKTAYATFIIPAIWKASGISPVVVATGKGCDDKKNQVEGKWNRKWLPYSKKLMDYWQCIDGETYFLLAAPGKEAEGCQDDCKAVAFRPVQGMEKLADWGIDWRDIIKSSVAGYKKNDKKNGYKVDSVDKEALEDMYDQQYSAAGIFSIPVCSENEAREHWWDYSNGGKGKRGKFYPCDSD